MNLKNLTLNTIVVCGAEISPSGEVARCAEETVPAGEIDAGGVGAIPVVRRSYMYIVGLPPSAPDTAYIVSGLVAEAAWAAGRTDVYAVMGDSALARNPIRNPGRNRRVVVTVMERNYYGPRTVYTHVPDRTPADDEYEHGQCGCAVHICDVPVTDWSGDWDDLPVDVEDAARDLVEIGEDDVAALDAALDACGCALVQRYDSVATMIVRLPARR